MKTNKLILLSFFALFAFTAIVGCRKKGETIAKIYVRDAANQAVPGAQVVLYGQSSNIRAFSKMIFQLF